MLLPALFVGAASVLAFAPFGLWPVQIVTLAVAFRLILKQTSIRRSVLVGWSYSFGWSVCGIHWLYISMHRYGELPGWMAAAAVALLAAYLALFTAGAMAAAAWLRQRWTLRDAVMLTAVFPPLWMLSEWLRGWVLTGFSWSSSGYAHTTGPLAGYAPLVGVYGIGWMAALLAGCIAMPKNRRALACATLLVAGGFGLTVIPWTHPHGHPVSVRLLQGNVEQEMKFAPEQISNQLDLYYDLIRSAPADLIATPETAVPLMTNQLPPDYLSRLSDTARRSNSYLAVGIPINDGGGHYTNSTIGFSPQPPAGTGLPYQYRYDKYHLVPFGEFIPTGFHGFVDMMRIPLGDFARGAALQQPFAVKDQWVLPNICYEDLFGEEIADRLAASHFSGGPQATILLNMSNIGWFGDSIALPQHLQISQMRALETGRPMLRSTNTGATAYIDAHGKVVARLPAFQDGVLSANVQGYAGITPYILGGNVAVVALALACLGVTGFLARRNRMKPPAGPENR